RSVRFSMRNPNAARQINPDSFLWGFLQLRGLRHLHLGKFIETSPKALIDTIAAAVTLETLILRDCRWHQHPATVMVRQHPSLEVVEWHFAGPSYVVDVAAWAAVAAEKRRPRLRVLALPCSPSLRNLDSEAEAIAGHLAASELQGLRIPLVG